MMQTLYTTVQQQNDVLRMDAQTEQFSQALHVQKLSTYGSDNLYKCMLAELTSAVFLMIWMHPISL